MKKKLLKRVLFIYPNTGSLRIPLAVAILSAKLKNLGVEVRVFDTTFYQIEDCLDYSLMESRRVVKKTRLDEIIGEMPQVNIATETKRRVAEYQPDLILITVLERHYWLFDILVRACKKVASHIPILAGGILPTIYPDIIINHSCVDYVAFGEGENFIDDLVEYFDRPCDFIRIPNLLYREKNGTVIKNPLTDLAEMDSVPYQDWEEFNSRQLLKPYDGNVWIGGSFEFSRGCYKRCTFCVAPQLRNSYGKKLAKKYHRTKSPDMAIAEIKDKKEKYNLTFLAMCDTDFLLGVPEDILKEFCRLYKKEINLPWIIQSSAESFSEKKLSALVDAGCVSASIGVESGSPKIRKQVIKKFVSLDRIKKTFDLCRDYNLRTTANYMIGLPYETEEDVNKTIEFNRRINPPSVAVTYFTPFLGTELYDLCIKAGFYDKFNPQQNLYKYSPLQMPQLSKQRIEELVKVFIDDFESYKQDIINIPNDIIQSNNKLVDNLYLKKQVNLNQYKNSKY